MNRTTTTYSVPESRPGMSVLSELDLRVSRFLTEDTPRPPAFLLGAALLFWGWQSELIFPAIIMGLLLEGARYSTVRWEFSSEDFNRIWTFCTLLFLASLVYAFTENDGPSAFATLMQEPTLRAQSQAGSSSARTAASIIRWLPMVFFVFLGAQVYSTRQGVPMETISLILRRRWKKARKEGKPLPPSRSVDISWIFFGLCIFGASIQNTNRAAFFWGTCFLLGWALWSQKSVRYGLPTWGAALALAIGLGYVGQTGFGRLQRYIENMNARWWTQMSPRGTDAGFSRTAMGRIGRLKLSQAIVVRLETQPGMNPPPLLREASYREFSGHIWRSAIGRHEMETMAPETNQTSWVLVPGRTNGAVVKISSYLPGSRGLLPLPSGTGKLENLPVFLLYKNPLGAIFAEGPGLVVFDAIYSPGPTVDSPPDEIADLEISNQERPAIEAVAEEIGLGSLSPEQKLVRLREYFEENFSYSTFQREYVEGRETPLTRFLLRDRKGHCEFFATAAVLLCRQAGIPARYAVGYAVHEGEEGKYVIRERDAHAWCLFWNEDKGRWQDFDATPPSWIEVEGGTDRSTWRKIADGWARVKYEFSKVRWGQSPLRTYLLYALVPILAFLFYRIVFRKRQRADTGKRAGRTTVWPGLDSEFYELERRLVSRGLVREPHETMRSWFARASNDPRFSPVAEPFGRLLLLHYRYRFDPEGLTAAERAELEREARAWLQQV